ncbi:MAG: 3-demethylubiquinone-9 3-methyltransferase [Thermoleophilia bacterium]|nr:3-demethylubiquinone-9 3-methyltransferase [Thermoleophilia bacterium]
MITTCLWFDGNAEEAANFYVSVLRDGSIGHVERFGEELAEASGQPAGSAMTVDFTVEGAHFSALNGGPNFTFSEAVSFVVLRDTQAELDEVWNALIADGGEESQCGWCKDRFGLSWQVLPSNIRELLGGGDDEANQRATEAMLQMRKLDIETLQRAAAGEPTHAG